MNRRSFAKLLPAAAALPALAAAAPPLIAQQTTPDTAAAPPLAALQAAPDTPAAPPSPLTSAQMAQYQKNAPQRARANAHLRAYPLTNAIQPDFVFFAAPAQRKKLRGGKP